MSQSSNPQGNLEEKSQLEEAITHLISDLPSVPASEDKPSSSPKAIILSPDTLPFAEQTNKVDIDKIDPYTVLQDKDDQIPKQESKEHEHTLGNNNSSSAEQCPISDSESMMNDAHNNHNNVQNADMSVQSNILATTCESNMNPCQSVSLSHISRLDVSQNVNGLNAQVKIEQCDNVLSPDALRENDIKLKRGIETFNHQTQELVIQYFDDSASDSSVISQGIETHNRYMLKRVCSDEDLPAMHSKRRSNNMLHASTNANDEQQCVSYVNCETFATEDKYSAVKFNQYYDVNSQPLIIAESPNSSLDHEIETEFHQQLVDPAATIIDEEQYLQDLKNYIAQNSDLSSHSGKL